MAKSMSFLDYTKKALNIALHPGSINDSYSVGDALVFYYKAAVIPAIAAAVLGFLLLFILGTIGLGAFSTFTSTLSGLAALGGVLLGIIGAVIGLAYVLLFIPIGIIIDGAIYHFFAKTLFRLWTKDISKTITATMYATIPVMLFVWTIFIPIIGYIVLVAASVWSFIVLIIAMARLQQVSGWRAFGGILIASIVIAIIAVVIEFTLFAIAFTSLYNTGVGYASSYCIPNSGFACANETFANGVLKADIAQATGTNMMKASIFFVPSGTNLSASDPSYYLGNFRNTGFAPITISGIRETNNNVSGNLTLEYYTSVSQTTPYVKNVAIVYLGK